MLFYKCRLWWDILKRLYLLEVQSNAGFQAGKDVHPMLKWPRKIIISYFVVSMLTTLVKNLLYNNVSKSDPYSHERFEHDTFSTISVYFYSLLTEYYTDYSWISVPSEEWNNGCPEEKIVCCAGYIERKVSNNCLSKLSNIFSLPIKGILCLYFAAHIK